MQNMIVMTVFSLACFIGPAFIWMTFLIVSRLRSKTTVGKIIDYASGSSDGDVSAPIVEFQLPDGQKVTFTGMYQNQTIIEGLYEAFLQHGLKKGLTQVQVLYDPKNPQKARINSFSNIYLVPVLLLMIGFCIILYSIPVFHDFLAPIFNFLDRLTNSL
ncbi:MAG: DUF3592 domain-containing protein [Anaerolineales bacterium]